ncbi:amino acid adenylation domain-containing protein [Micromonospora sp. NPDC051227]|uniref:amino acid adenylation domain-containing protein n=1 Tax=Micromonospora sp. NPDC051227 TaxID=3364285 RepID=UPI0037AC85AE
MISDGRSSSPHSLSPAQLQLWLHDRLQPGNAVYNVPIALRLRGALDVTALRAALRELIRRHDVLRTSYPERDGVPIQLVSPADDVALVPVDLAHLTAADRETELRRWLYDEANHPFDLLTGPVLRVSLLRMALDDHVLVVCIHHIAFDGASQAILLGEMQALYRDFLERRQPSLPRLPLQYTDFAREQLSGTWKPGLEYWQAQLADLGHGLQLPTDRPRPGAPTTCGGHVRFSIDDALVDGLSALARQSQATLFAVMMTAFQALLSHYSNQRDFVVGVPVLARPAAELDPLIGLFVNTLSIRADLTGEPTIRELLSRVQHTMLGAFEHMDVPFHEVVKAVAPERESTYTPLVDVTLSLLSEDLTGAIDLPGLSVEQLHVERDTTKFPLSLDIVQTAGRFHGEFEYSLDLFDEETIQRFAGHFVSVLTAMVADPDVPVSSIDVLTDAERHRVLDEWNDTTVPGLDRHVLVDLFEDQVRRTPNAVAVVLGDERVTFHALECYSNKLAHAIRRRLTGADTRVGICLERSIDSVVALLAALKAGSCFVALDPHYPPDRLAYMLADSECSLLITRSLSVGAVPPHGIAQLVIDTDPTIEEEPDTPPERSITPDHIACMIYTSGSTGAPKCAMLTHANFANYFNHFDRAYDLRNTLRAHLQMASFAFDLFIADLMRALFTGGTLVLCPREVALSPRRLAELIDREGVTSAEFIPPLLSVLLDHLEETGESLSSMNLLMAGGDAWTVRDYLRARSLCPPSTRLVGTYGLTEAAIDNSNFTSGDVGDDVNGVVPIGRPLANTRLYILNPAMRPVPVGVPGELFIAGLGVGLGYYGKPAITAERFVPDPFSPTPGTRMYRTGDLTCYRPDGTIEILGRIDNQVKVRGFRIELGEVESALRGHADVDDAVVVATGAQGGERQLAAYVSMHGESVDAVRLVAELRAHLAARLPRFMVPASVAVLDSMPLNANGKVDRARLPAPAPVAEVMPALSGATPVEEIISGIWANLLHRSDIGLHDDFFQVGGHSLLATRVSMRIQSALHVEVPVRSVYDHQTVAALAKYVEAIVREQTGHASTPIDAVPRDGTPLPLSFAQERLWFLQQVDPESAVYNVLDVLHLAGALHVEALERSFLALIARHEVLRTALVSMDGEPRQVVQPAPTRWTIQVRDLSALPPERRSAEVTRCIGSAERTPFDLATGPMLRATLLRLAAREHVLLLAQHHIVTDAWSEAILADELWHCYRAYLRHAEPDLPALTVQYADYAQWQRQVLRGGLLERQSAYWRTQLADLPFEPDVPLDRPRRRGREAEGRTVSFAVPSELVQQLKSLAGAESSTLFMTLLAAFQVLLSRVSGRDDVVVGTPVNNRSHPDTERLLGFFVNTLVIRTRVNDDPAFRAVLRQVRDTTLKAYDNQELPFEKVVELVRPDRQGAAAQLFQSLFVLERRAEEQADAPGLRVKRLPFDSTTSKFDLSLVVAERETGFEATMWYRSEFFLPTTAERLLRQWLTLLKEIVSQPDVPVAALPLYHPEETRGSSLVATMLPVEQFAVYVDRLLPGLRKDHALPSVLPTYVLDRALRPVPVGVAGELYLGGLVLGVDHASADALTPDPFADDPRALLLRTGRMARRTETGLNIQGIHDLEPGSAPGGSAPEDEPADLTAVAEVLAAIWCDVLELTEVGPDDDFFELGGFSLLTMRVRSRIEALLGVRLPVTVLLEAATLTQLSKEVEQLMTDADRDRLRQVLASLEQELPVA